MGYKGSISLALWGRGGGGKAKVWGAYIATTPVFHWAALKSFEYSALTKSSPFEAICQTLGRSVEILPVKTRLSSVVENVIHLT